MSAVLDQLPSEIARHRVLATRDACEFVGVSISEWRNLRARGEAPPPIMLGSKKHGWRVGDLIAWLESRQSQDRPAA
jgi:predicted DNA-binding transcriptional regulator AlpA